jgi:hypothetical protein
VHLKVAKGARRGGGAPHVLQSRLGLDSFNSNEKSGRSGKVSEDMYLARISTELCSHVSHWIGLLSNSPSASTMQEMPFQTCKIFFVRGSMPESPKNCDFTVNVSPPPPPKKNPGAGCSKADKLDPRLTQNSEQTS